MTTFRFLVLTLLVTASPRAFAQDASPGGDALAGGSQASSNEGDQNSAAEVGDIVVTAQRREERLQDVPIAVSAISGADLERSGIVGTADLPAVVPGLVISKSTWAVQPFLRGVGTSTITPGIEPSVATYIDGVYQAAPNGLFFTFNNIERIEVLKGPQGTLFGRNSTGGLIQIATRDPTSTTEANFKVGYGRFNAYESSAYISGGTDKIAADLAIIYNRQWDGWGRNLFTPSQATPSGTGTVLVGGVPKAVPALTRVQRQAGDLNEFAIRSKVVFTPTEDLTMKFSGSYVESRNNQGGYRRPLYGAIPQITQAGAPPFIFSGGFYDYHANVPTTLTNSQYAFSADLEYEASFATLKSITAYQNADSYTLVQSSAQPYVDDNAAVTSAPIPVKFFSQELQLASNPGSVLTWVIGAYYSRISASYDRRSVLRGNFLARSTQLSSTQVVNSKAVFAQAGIDLGPRTQLTLGARYTSDDIRAGQIAVGENPLAAPGTAQFPGVVSSFVNRVEDSQAKLTWRVALDHHITEDIMVYASANRGFKSGSFTTAFLCFTSPIGSCPASNLVPVVEPEVLTAYEIGFKSTLLDRKLRFNAAAFYYDYQNLQVQTAGVDPQGAPVIRVINAAASRIYGADFDAVAVISRNFSINGGLSLLNAKYSSFPVATGYVPRTAAPYGDVLVTIDAKGKHLARSPSYTFNVGAKLTVPLGAANLDFDTNYFRSGKFYWEVTNRLAERPYGLLNASATLTLPDDHWAFRIWGRNILGTKYYSFQTAAATFGDQGSPGAPFTFGGTISWKY